MNVVAFIVEAMNIPHIIECSSPESATFDILFCLFRTWSLTFSTNYATVTALNEIFGICLFLVIQALVGAKRHLVNTKTKDACGGFLHREAALPQNQIMLCVPEATVSDIMVATPTALSSRSRRGTRLRAAIDPSAKTGIMTVATWRIWSDVWIPWCENNLAGAKRRQS